MLREDPDFLEHCYRRVLGELGFSAEHAEVVARCVSDGDRNGKLTQGMGVFEIPVLLARTGTMDVAAVPEVVARVYTKADNEFVMEMIATGRIDPAPLISHRIGLDALPEAFEALRTPTDQCKVMVMP